MNGTIRTDATFLNDKPTQNWAQVMTRASGVAPINIDALLVGNNSLARHRCGDINFPPNAFGGETCLKEPPSRPVIAVLLPDAAAPLATQEIHVLATRYAALAIEKECDVVILTHQNNAGFERFGFRVERLAGATDTEKEACAAQLRAFWGFQIVV